MLLPWFMHTTAPGMQLLGLAPITSFLEGSPVNVEFGSLGKSSYVSQLNRRIRFAHNTAKQMAKRQQAKHREL